MKDSELRGLVLQAVYDRRKQPLVSFMKLVPDVPDMEVSRILKQLEDSGLITWGFKDIGTGLGSGQITTYGTEIIEGEAAPPFAITMIDNSIKISDSTGVQIGQGNTQNVQTTLHSLNAAIDKADALPAAKAEAKSLVQKISENPLLNTIIGGLIKAATG